MKWLKAWRMSRAHSYSHSRAHSPSFPLLYLRHISFSNPSLALPTSQLILQPFRCFTYVTVHSQTLPLLHLRHSSFSNPSFASATSQLILQPFRCFTYVTAHSPTLLLLHVHHSSFTNPSFASPTSQALHLIHLSSHPWQGERNSCLCPGMLSWWNALNSRHHKMWSMIANEPRSKNFHIFEEVHGLAMNGSTRRIDIISFHQVATSDTAWTI